LKFLSRTLRFLENNYNYLLVKWMFTYNFASWIVEKGSNMAL
jgi:hypothetical protein